MSNLIIHDWRSDVKIFSKMSECCAMARCHAAAFVFFVVKRFIIVRIDDIISITNMKTKRLSDAWTVMFYSFAHFFVDFACAVAIFKIFHQVPDDVVAVMLVYNFFAFAGQMPVGIIADYVKNNALISAIGCFMVLATVIIVAAAPVLASCTLPVCVIAGIGNAFFHIGGGVDVLSISKARATLPGIYVATGAMGLFLGGAFCEELPAAIIAILAMAVCTIIFFVLRQHFPVKSAAPKNVKANAFKIDSAISKSIVIIVMCLLLTICVRSYLGLIMQFPWKTSFAISLAAVFAVVAGKMAGGAIGDRFGWRKISIASLVVAAVLFLFSFDSPVCGIIAIFLFNFTMPITLTALANLFPNHHGLVFGSTTFALFVGAVPTFLGQEPQIFNPLGLCISTVISALVLYLGLTLYYRVRKKDD